MKLLEDVYKARSEREKLYEDLHNDPIDLDSILGLMIDTIHDSYIGRPAKRLRFTANEYRTYILSHHRYNTLTLEMLVRAMHQFAGDMADRRLRFYCDDWVDYKNYRASFRVRAFEDCLYVTSAEPETGLVPGDKILKMQRLKPDDVRQITRHNCFYSREKERELWGGYLRMVNNAEVEHADGTKETITLKKLPACEEKYTTEFRMPGENAYLLLEEMDYGKLSALLEAHKSEIEQAQKLIIDLRRNIGGDEECAELLLPYIADKAYKTSELECDEGHYTLFSKQNCELRYVLLKNLRESVEDSETLALIDAEIEKYVKNNGKGAVFIPPVDDGSVIVPAAKAPAKTVILTDTFCENEAERLVLMAQHAGAKVKVIGRPTMGTLDYFDTVTMALNSHMTLTYPISATKAAYEGRGIAEKGLPVDEYIPWTPAEIEKDVILERALEI